MNDPSVKKSAMDLGGYLEPWPFDIPLDPSLTPEQQEQAGFQAVINDLLTHLDRKKKYKEAFPFLGAVWESGAAWVRFLMAGEPYDGWKEPYCYVG